MICGKLIFHNGIALPCTREKNHNGDHYVEEDTTPEVETMAGEVVPSQLRGLVLRDEPAFTVSVINDGASVELKDILMGDPCNKKFIDKDGVERRCTQIVYHEERGDPEHFYSDTVRC